MQDPATLRARPSTAALWCALFGIGMAWGSSQYFSKVVVTAGHHALGMSIATATLGAVIITAFALARGVRLPLSRRHLVFYAICGLTGTALPNYTSFTAMGQLPLGVMAIIIAAVPMMTFVAALVFRIERPAPRRLIGLLIGAVAVLILVIPDASLPRPGDAIWVVVALTTGISYTVENIYIAKARPEDCSALQTLCGLSWMSVLLILPLVTATDTWMVFAGFGMSEAGILGMTLTHLMAYGGFVWLITSAGPVFAAQVGYVVTLTGVLLGILLLGESHSNWVWLSLALMFCGLALVQPKKG